MLARFVSIALLVTVAACTPPAQAPNEPPATAQIAAGDVRVDAPIAGARVTSPLSVSGEAPADWFFENQFPVRLVGANGAELAFAPAAPRVNWTEPGPKMFDAQLSFSVTADTPATLVLQEDMPGDGETPREVRIPVVLTLGG